jgi:hypothetical protein
MCNSDTRCTGEECCFATCDNNFRCPDGSFLRDLPGSIDCESDFQCTDKECYKPSCESFNCPNGAVDKPEDDITCNDEFVCKTDECCTFGKQTVCHFLRVVACFVSKKLFVDNQICFELSY